MKRLALAAIVLSIAACSPQDEASTVDTSMTAAPAAAPAPVPAPAAIDTTAIDTTAADTTAADTTAATPQ